MHARPSALRAVYTAPGGELRPKIYNAAQRLQSGTPARIVA